MEEQKIIPNFYCSIPYWIHSGCTVHNTEECIWVEVDNICLFPPISKKETFSLNKLSEVKEIWCDFSNSILPEGWRVMMLDWEYIYDPLSFREMKGGVWETFRKNSRKWPKLHDHYKYGYYIPTGAEIGNLMGKWMEKRQSTVLDPVLIIEMVCDPTIPRKYLYDGNRLVGINLWDENYQFINFRFCICDDEPFLSEFLRWLFYTDPEIISKNKLVNDGGVLDNPNLKRFKDKMNPVKKRIVHTFIKN